MVVPLLCLSGKCLNVRDEIKVPHGSVLGSRRRTLHSRGGGLLLDVPRVNLERYGRRAFACAGPTLWNSLPLELRALQNTRQF